MKCTPIYVLPLALFITMLSSCNLNQNRKLSNEEIAVLDSLFNTNIIQKQKTNPFKLLEKKVERRVVIPTPSYSRYGL